MNSTVADHNVQELLEMISGINADNLLEVNSELDKILGPHTLLPPFKDDDDQVTSGKEIQLPTGIALPSGVAIPENLLDRTTLTGPVTLNKLATNLMNNELTAWGIIRRADSTLAYQFLVKRRKPIKKKMPTMFQQPIPSETATISAVGDTRVNTLKPTDGEATRVWKHGF